MLAPTDQPLIGQRHGHSDAAQAFSLPPCANIDEIIRGRCTVRAFLPDPVPRHLLAEIIELAARAPSTFNTQPWRLHVLTGAARQALVDAILEAHAGNGEPAFTPFPSPQPADCVSLQAEFGRLYYAALSIDRDDQAARARQTARNYCFFGAPVGLLFSIDARLTRNSWVDVGLFLQTLMLAAHARGLGTCPQVSLLRYERVIASRLGFSENESLVCAMSLGHPDPDAPVNRMAIPRRSPEAFAKWHGFDEHSDARVDAPAAQADE
jgi:nitroreductase